MPRAVKFSRYGGSDVLEVVDVDQPHPGPGEVVVRVVAAATNPGEMMIREGAFADVWPATFPEGQGNDFSGRVAEVGPGEAGFSPGDEVLERIQSLAPDGVDAYLDNFGAGNVDLAIKLGVAPDRINTIIDGAAASRYGAHSDAQEQADSPPFWEELAQLVAAGELTIPIQSVYPLEEVRGAYDELAARHTRGKIVLRVTPD